MPKAKEDFVVTPWEVRGNVDYSKLTQKFGVKELGKPLLDRLKRHAGELHPFLRRGVFFSHMYLDSLLSDYEKGKKFYLYTGRAPSGPVHIGHVVPWIFTRWLQEKFGATLLFQVPDEEKFLFKDGMTMDETSKWAYENILDIIAVGFDPKRTRIFLNTEYAKTMYRHACAVSKRITVSTAKSTFGFTDSNNVGEYFYTCMQSVPAFLPTILEGRETNCLIPCAIDQDVHFRLTRDVAGPLGYPKPATLLCRFLPGLQGMEQEGKMSSSEAHTAIFTTDAPKQVQQKVMKYAFSGGRDTVEEHRRKGGRPEVDVAYQWLTFFEESDAKLKRLHDDYLSGKMLSGEMKQVLVEKLNGFLAGHQERRERAKDSIEDYMLRD